MATATEVHRAPRGIGGRPPSYWVGEHAMTTNSQGTLPERSRLLSSEK